VTVREGCSAPAIGWYLSDLLRDACIDNGKQHKRERADGAPPLICELTQDARSPTWRRADVSLHSLSTLWCAKVA